MFNRKDPLVDVTRKVMDRNEHQRQIIAEFNSELGIQDRRQIPHEKQHIYDRALAERLNEAAGSSPRSEREADLAAKKPPYNKITKADVLKARGVIKQEEFKGDAQPFEASEKKASCNEAEKWIQKAIKHPGALHKQLEVPEGEKIPAEKLKTAAKAGGKLGKRARLAMTLKKMHEEHLEEKASEAQKEKVHKVMREFKKRKLHSGSKEGPTVTNPKQAVAIALSQAGLSKKKKMDESSLASIQEEIRNSLLEKAHWLKENDTQEHVVEFLNNLTMEQREILNLAEAGVMDTIRSAGRTVRDFVLNSSRPPGAKGPPKPPATTATAASVAAPAAQADRLAAAQNQIGSDVKKAYGDSISHAASDRGPQPPIVSTAQAAPPAAPGLPNTLAAQSATAVRGPSSGFGPTPQAPAAPARPAAPAEPSWKTTVSAADKANMARQGSGEMQEDVKNVKSLEKFLKEDFRNVKKS